MIIYAVNVNSGGGKVLLDRLLIENPFDTTTTVLTDNRYSPPLNFTGKIISFSVLGRLKAEMKLHFLVKESSYVESVLFFGNIPPLFKTKSKSYLYLQNCYLTGQVPLPKDSRFEWFRNLVEMWFLKLFYRKVDEIWVQSEWMKQVTLKWCPSAVIKVKPFLPLMRKANPQVNKKFKFTYVGSISTYKGLTTFVESLRSLDKVLTSKISVCIVLNNYQEEQNIIFSFKNITVHLKFRIEREEIYEIYESSQYLVVTSLYESLYLPVYEALHFGCKIIASEKAKYLSQHHGQKSFSFYDELKLSDYF